MSHAQEKGWSDGSTDGGAEPHRTSTASIVADAVHAAGKYRDEATSLIDPTTHTTAPIHVLSVIFNILQSTMGVGILSLAATFQFAGLAGGSIAMVFVAIIAIYSMRMLTELLLLTKQESYEGLGEFCFGRLGKLWVQLALIGCSMLALTCFLVPLKAFIFNVLQELLSEAAFETFKHHGGSANSCLGVALLLVIVPLSLLRKVDKLWFTSLLGTFFVLFFTVVSFIYLFKQGDLDTRKCYGIHKNHPGHQYIPTKSARAFADTAATYMQAFSVLACSYCCQFTLFPIYRELKVADTPTAAVRKLDISVAISMFIVTLIYILAAASGYLTWRDISKDPSSILACYKPSDPLIIITYFGMSCVLMFAFPLVSFAIRYSFATFLYDDDECQNLTTGKHLLLTAGVILPVAGVALVAHNLTTVITVGGAVTAPQICYVIPGALYIRAKALLAQRNAGESSDDDLEGGVEDGIGEALIKETALASGSATIGWAMMFFGIATQILMIVGAVVALA